VVQIVEKLGTDQTPPGIYQILSELIQLGGKRLHSEIHKLITHNSVLNTEDLPHSERNLLLY
jgi:hypothetical protein